MSAYEDTNLHKAMYRRIQVPADGFLQIIPNTGCHFHAYEFYNGVEFSRDYKFGNNNKLEPYEDEVSTALNRCLRHHAGKVMFNPRYGLKCDDAGWVDIDDLLKYETIWKQDKTRVPHIYLAPLNQGHDKRRWNGDEVMYRFQTLFRIMFHSARYGNRVREQILAFGIGQVVTNKDIPFSKIRGAWVQDYQQRWIRLIVPSGEEQVVRSGYRSMRTATKASVIRLATQCANAAEEPYDEDTMEVFTILSRFEQHLIPEGGREQYEARQKLTDFILERKQVTEAGCRICPLCIGETPVKLSICLNCWCLLESHGIRPFRMNQPDDNEDEAVSKELDEQIRKAREEIFKATVDEAQEQQASASETQSQFDFNTDEVDYTGDDDEDMEEEVDVEVEEEVEEELDAEQEQADQEARQENESLPAWTRNLDPSAQKMPTIGLQNVDMEER
eukprot:s118_g12.t1